MIENKSGELLSMWWFFVLIIIGVGIIAGTLMFASEKIDVRTIQADVISNKIIDCVVDFGVISDILSSDFNLFDSCYIDKGIFDSSGNYFLRINLTSGLGEVKNELTYGNRAFVEDCKISLIQADNYPRCVKKELLVLDSSGNSYKLNIMVGSNYEFR
ncbi:hypothetical protein FJZ17_03625 [Candidatus Pacearchaeota archaeon]|nr:hypothetical protein [Candidatus Pacearchaeota archaeon]